MQTVMTRGERAARTHRDVYLNYNVVISDCGFITIKDRALIGPGVMLLGAIGCLALLHICFQPAPFVALL